MRNKHLMTFLCFMLASVVTTTFATPTDSPVGYWKTIDDVTGETKSIVEITASASQELQGRVIKLFQDPNKTCPMCSGSRKNQPVVGMFVMEGLKQAHPGDHLWANGKILDPKNGKIYRCNIQTLESNRKLIVRGYLGIPLFGRSQTWMRVENPQKA